MGKIYAFTKWEHLSERRDPTQPPRNPPDGLLPNMSIDAPRNLLLFYHCERRRRKTSENFIENENLNVSFGLLLLPEPVELIQSGID